MRTTTIGLIVLGLAVPAAARPPEEDDVQLLEKAAAVLAELHGTPDGGMPRALRLKAKCVVVVPGLTRAAFVPLAREPRPRNRWAADRHTGRPPRLRSDYRH